MSTDTPVPTPTPIPTPTPDLRDAYEPDDNPKPIAVGETQTHNFYPDSDEDKVDKVEFLAKAGRSYRVFTSGLALGVDTSLKVSVGGATYTNDDRQPGDLSSEVVFQAGGDVWPLVEVTNRGQYGPDKWYQITVEEIVPTPTPTPTSTPTTSSSSRSPGVTSLIPGLAWADPLNRSKPPSRGRPMGAFPGRPAPGTGAESVGVEHLCNMTLLGYSASGEKGAAGVFSAEAVEFVIVLELR